MRMPRSERFGNVLKVVQLVESGARERPAPSKPGAHRLSKAAQSRGAGGAVCPRSDFVQSWL